MGRSFRANSETVVATTAQTIVFADNTIPQGGISALIVETTGVNNALDTANGLTGVRVKLEGVPVVDISGPMLRAILEAFMPASTPPSAGQLRFTIPMAVPFPMTNLWGYSSLVGGIPFGVKTSVELIFGTSSSTGTALIGWETIPAAPAYMLKTVQQQTGLGLNTTNGRININYGDNDVIGFLFPNAANKFSRLRIVSMREDGTEEQIDHGDNAMTVEYQRRYSPLTITDPLAIKLDRPYKFRAGSYLEVDTGSAALVGDVFAALQTVDVRKSQS